MKHLFAIGLSAVLAWGIGSGAARAQASPSGGPPVGWLRISSVAPLRGHWSLHSEVETRQNNAQLAAQYLGRVGLRWHYGPSFSVTTGYVLAYNELQPGDPREPLPEHRLYQEIALADATGPLRVGHRLRAEERWLRPAPEAGFRFAPRLRYHLRLVAPLRRDAKLPVGSLFLTASNEFFAGLGAHTGRSFLEENRLSGGLGYRLSRLTTVELAYLRQTQTAGYEAAPLARNAVQLSLAYAPAARQSLVRQPL
ncbi:hypothetical protein GCM10023185_40910 [Hymenobacter saemangeumensis]|uniref:DUF2490 domain-containing protein n=1 Tax=Hymenobacter saemangeumensis TaxID=1084522 RepID=A0ABP8IRA8_9BACT